MAASNFCFALSLNMCEDIVTSPGGTVTSFGCLNGRVGVLSIRRSRDLEPGPDFAEDGRQLMARTKLCG